MKTISTLALGLSVSLLTACGGSSSSSDSVESYDTDSYEGRTVSSDSLAGTWVSVHSGDFTDTEDGVTVKISYASKEYFVIRPTDNGYEKASCSSSLGFRDVRQEEDGQVTFDYNNTASVTDNKEMSGTLETYYFDSEEVPFQALKISDQFDSIGSMSTTGSVAAEEDIFCFSQSNGILTWNGSHANSSQDYKAGFEGDYIRFSKDEEDINIYSPDYDFNTYEGETASLSVSSKSDSSQQMSFYGSNDSDDINGTIQIQLPLQ